jgi:hypothetical protein
MSWYNPNRPASGKGKGKARPGSKGEPFFRPRVPRALPGVHPDDERMTAAPETPVAPDPPSRPEEVRPTVLRPPDEPERGEFR